MTLDTRNITLPGIAMPEPFTSLDTVRRGVLKGLCGLVGLHLLPALNSPVMAQPQDLADTGFWQGSLTILEQAGPVCKETSAGEGLPYRKSIVLRLEKDGKGRLNGLAWGEMLPARLDTFVVPAATRAGGPQDAEIQGPADVFRLTWLPEKGGLASGPLAASSHVRLTRQGDVLEGRWRERMATGAGKEQCVWSEAELKLSRVPPAESAALLKEASALQASLELMDAQALRPADARWGQAAISELLAHCSGLAPGRFAAQSLMPMLARLTELMFITQSAIQARPLLTQSQRWLEVQIEARPLEMSAYVTHMTPLFRAAGMLVEARALNDKAVSVLMAKGHEQSGELGHLLSGYGALLMRLKANTQALQVYEQALGIEKGIQGGKQIGVVIALINLSQVCEKLGDTVRAHQYADEASALHEALGLGPLKKAPATRGGPRAI